MNFIQKPAFTQNIIAKQGKDIHFVRNQLYNQLHEYVLYDCNELSEYLYCFAFTVRKQRKTKTKKFITLQKYYDYGFPELFISHIYGFVELKSFMTPNA